MCVCVCVCVCVDMCVCACNVQYIKTVHVSMQLHYPANNCKLHNMSLTPKKKVTNTDQLDQQKKKPR